MATNYVREGDEFGYTNGTAAAINAGDLVTIGTMVAVALDNIAIGATGAVKLNGVFTLPKLGTDVIAELVDVYWDPLAGNITLTSTSNTLAGKAFAAAGNGVTTVQVLLNGLPD